MTAISGSTDPRPRLAFTRVWILSSLVVAALGALWVLATPIGAAPDEPTQIVKAAAVVRGELIGTTAPGFPTAVTVVRVPASFGDDANVATCFAFRSDVPAGCARPLGTSDQTVSVGTYVGRYPPLYYLLVGTPSLLWRGAGAVRAMRLLSVLWSSLLLGLALAVAAVWSRSPLLVLALAVTITPLVVFLTAVVNPSGLEISAAVATWTTVVVLVLDHRRDPPRTLVAATAAAATVLALCRGLSDLWLAIAAVTALALAPSALGLLGRRRSVQRAAVWPTLAAIAGGTYVLAADTLSVVPDGVHVARGSSTADIVVDTLGRAGAIAHQAIGVFGWLDTPSPFAVEALWWGVGAVVVVAGVVWTSRHNRTVLVALGMVVLVLPTAIVASQAGHDGLVWQARDGMPLYVGLPLVAGAVAGRFDHRRGTGAVAPVPSDASGRPTVGSSVWTALHTSDTIGRLSVVVAGVVGACQWIDFTWALRRYTVGLDGPLLPWRHVRGGWQPPVDAVVLVLAAAIVAAVYARWVHRLAIGTLAPTLGLRTDGSAMPTTPLVTVAASGPGMRLRPVAATATRSAHVAGASTTTTPAGAPPRAAPAAAAAPAIAAAAATPTAPATAAPATAASPATAARTAPATAAAAIAAAATATPDAATSAAAHAGTIAIASTAVAATAGTTGRGAPVDLAGQGDRDVPARRPSGRPSVGAGAGTRRERSQPATSVPSNGTNRTRDARDARRPVTGQITDAGGARQVPRTGARVAGSGTSAVAPPQRRAVTIDATRRLTSSGPVTRPGSRQGTAERRPRRSDPTVPTAPLRQGASSVVRPSAGARDTTAGGPDSAGGSSASGPSAGGPTARVLLADLLDQTVGRR